MEITIDRRLAPAERAQMAALYWQAFQRKLRPAFASEGGALRVITEALCADRTILARADGELLGVCGFQLHGAGAVDPDWRTLRASLSRPAALRATLLLVPLARTGIEDVLVLDGICVDASRRGEGIGSALLEAAAKMAHDEGLRAVRLSVVDANPRAEALYRRRGFEPIATGTMGPLSRLYGFRRHTTMERRTSG